MPQSQTAWEKKEIESQEIRLKIIDQFLFCFSLNEKEHENNREHIF